MDGEAYLINTSYVQDDIGAWHKQESERRIFVSEKSMGRSEWYNAGRNGFKPEIVLTTQSINYSGEEKVKYKNCLLYTSPSPRDTERSRMPSSA